MKEDSKTNDDEKIDDEWKQICSVRGVKQYGLKGLDDNRQYLVRGRLRNNIGYGLYCDPKTFKTSLVLFIMF